MEHYINKLNLAHKGNNWPVVQRKNEIVHIF